MRQNEEQLASWLKVNESVESLKEKIRLGPSTLREYIRFLSFGQPEFITFPPIHSQGPTSVDPGQDFSAAQQAPSPIQSPLTQGPPGAPLSEEQACFSLPQEERILCLVKIRVRAMFAEYSRYLKENILAPLGKTGPEAALRALEESFYHKLEAQPNFWKTYEGKEGFFVEITAEFEKFWEDYGALIEKETEELNRRIKEMKEEEGVLRAKATAIEDRKRELEKRLEDFESPLGKLPVSLEDAVRLFPLVLAAAFMWASAVFGQMMTLRRQIELFYHEKDPERRVATPERLRILLGPPAGFLKVFIVPFLLYLVSSGLNAYDFFIGRPSANPEGIALSFLYAAGLLLFAAGFRRFRKIS